MKVVERSLRKNEPQRRKERKGKARLVERLSITQSGSIRRIRFAAQEVDEMGNAARKDTPYAQGRDHEAQMAADGETITRNGSAYRPIQAVRGFGIGQCFFIAMQVPFDL